MKNQNQNRTKRLNFFGIIVCLSIILAASGVWAASPDRLAEIAQAVDIIFVGRVDGQVGVLDEYEMVSTDIEFADVEILYHTEDSRQSVSGRIVLNCPGGEHDDLITWVSGSPNFENDRFYLVLMFDDGGRYVNPVIDSSLGYYEVICDEATGEEYVLTSDGRAILGITDNKIVFSRDKVDMIQEGVASYFADPLEDILSFQENPEVHMEGGVVEPTDALFEAAEGSTPKTLRAFISYIMTEALARVVENPSLIFDAPESLPGNETMADRYEFNSGGSFYSKFSDLSACGPHGLPINMNQVVTSDWTHSLNNQILGLWNQCMGIYQTTPHNGPARLDNGEDEFVGVISNTQLNSLYGRGWGGADGLTVMRGYFNCGGILEADVMFNAAYTWTDDLDFYMDTKRKDVYFYRNTAIHETGHVWGYMNNVTESYHYNHPSAMFCYENNVLEDGKGLHAADVHFLRQNYMGKTPVKAFTDVGVEAYYTSGGASAAYLDVNSYFYPGESIKVCGVTVENMSDKAASDVRLRFYLSKDKTITTADHLIGNGWFGWSSFPKETHNIGSYSVPVPDGTPAGEYYVGMIVSVNGFNNDDNAANNVVYLKDKVTIYPSPPKNVNASDGTEINKILVTWDNVADADKYWVERNDGGIWKLKGTVTTNSFTDTKVEDGYYCYRIQSDGKTGFSRPSCIDCGYIGVATPGNVAATDGLHYDKIAVSWDAAPGAIEYEVWRQTQSMPNTLTKLATVTTTGYNDTSAVPEIMYEYQVRGRTSLFQGPLSNYECGWRQLIPPANVAATDGVFTGKVRVTWDSVPYAAYYEVYRNTNLDCPTATKIASSVLTTSYDDTTVLAGTTYYYWVKAVNSFGMSYWSNHDTGNSASASDNDNNG